MLSGCLAVLASGCAGPLFAGAAGDGSTVVFANTGGALPEVFAGNAYPELEQQGVSVAEEAPNNEAKLTAMVEGGSPTWDLYYSTPYLARAECGTLFEPLDPGRIDTAGIDPEQITECGVPIVESSLLLVYNTETYADDPPESWADFYDTERFPGTRGIMNFAKDGGMETALLADGVPGDELYPLDYDRAFAQLEQVRDSVRFYETGAQQTQGLQSGEVDMMLAWPGRAYDAQQAGAPIDVAWNQPVLYTDVLTVVKGAREPDLAYDLLNSLISTANQQAIADRLPYRPANSDAAISDDPDIRAFVDDPQAHGTEVQRDDAWWAQNEDEATQRWTDWVNR
ncbi:extracellular solute-binding protein [Nocardiopsis coralliicola]